MTEFLIHHHVFAPGCPSWVTALLYLFAGFVVFMIGASMVQASGKGPRLSDNQATFVTVSSIVLWPLVVVPVALVIVLGSGYLLGKLAVMFVRGALEFVS